MTSDTTSSGGGNAQHCPATRKDGQPCGVKPGPSGYCFAHDPANAEHRARGGKHRANTARALRILPDRLRPVADQLANAIDEVHRGDLDPRQASAMAALAGALVRVVQAGELEERVRALETAAKAG